MQSVKDGVEGQAISRVFQGMDLLVRSTLIEEILLSDHPDVGALLLLTADIAHTQGAGSSHAKHGMQTVARAQKQIAKYLLWKLPPCTDICPGLACLNTPTIKHCRQPTVEDMIDPETCHCCPSNSEVMHPLHDLMQ